MTKFSSLKRNGSITKYRDKRSKQKYTDFTRDGKLPTKKVNEAKGQDYFHSSRFYKRLFILYMTPKQKPTVCQRRPA